MGIVGLFGWAMVKVKAMRWIIYRCLTKRLPILISGAVLKTRLETHYLFSPKSHLSVTKTVMIVMAISVAYEAVSMMKLTSNGPFKLFVCVQLCICFINCWRDVILATSLY